jgi:hypothetical protein
MNAIEWNREDLITYIYDEYKSVNGIRPRWVNFDEYTTEELSEWADRLETAIVEEEIRREEQEAKDNIRINELCKELNISREDYDRWMKEESDKNFWF